MQQLKDAITKPEVSFLMSVMSPIVAVAVSIAVMNNRVSYIENENIEFRQQYNTHVEKAEIRYERTNAEYAEIQVRLAELQKDISYIKGQFSK